MRKALLFFIINSGNFSFMNEKVKGPRWATNTNGRSDTRRGPGRGPKPKYNEKRFFSLNFNIRVAKAYF